MFEQVHMAVAMGNAKESVKRAADEITSDCDEDGAAVFSNDIRRIMYTTNIIEGLNRQYRKVTKTKSVFPSDSALEKMLYLASENVVKKWTQRYRNWDQVLNQLIVLYGERLTAYL